MAEQEPDRLAGTARDLGLPYDENDQDWGIMYADHTRLPEFIAYYRERSAEFNWGQRYDVGELILASANDAIVERHPHGDLLPTIFELLVADQDHPATRMLLEYWSSLHSDPEAIGADEVFPISRLLDRLIQETGGKE
ncbi:hypothetical protein V3W47_16935 [Deinococcus sp. YIM 134068]|uniref:hypothetical protein n=1 Tax=Deinococcus lichenicola TaxID=3118910 RepID=UPI002F9586B5